MFKALIVTDVQNDFCEGGALAVKGGDQVARDIVTFLADQGSDYELVVATRDWHDGDNDNSGHFAEEPDFIDSWPPHCVADTTGAEYHPELWPTDGRYPDIEVRKGQGIAAYSGFEGTDAEGQPLADILRTARISIVDVVGLAFDYCVKSTAIDAAQYGFETRVLKNLSAAIHPDGAAEADLVAAGVAVESSVD